ncbi:hypothetical protein [Kibdelosporangium philippinense]|uniref:hypothetical protein n=1 Tax=Kibdelosporangium philippinense TaxID=211113 RepID=UPI001F16E821|nr:hypothetical protein [Kibdelosporangium philippinense]
MSDVTRQYPALAKIAARAAGSASAAIQFSVGHFADEQADYEPPDHEPPQGIGEIMTVRIGGVGFELHTWSPVTPGHPPAGVLADELGAGRFGGSVMINPDFLYDSAYSTEILLTLGHDPWRPDYADSLMVTLAYKVMTTAAGGDVPILFLQSPVAPFKDPPPRFRVDGSGEAPRVSNGLALRMLIALDTSNPRKRLALVRNIAWVAAEYGMGLQVTDRRFGRVRGEWWSVLRHEPDIYQRKKTELFGWAPDGVPDCAQLLTFVGPARIGASAAIAADLLARNVGLLSISEATLQEVAFVNVVVPVAPARKGPTAASGKCLPIGAGLGALARDCGLTARRGARRTGPIEDTPATDYQLLRTGPVDPRVGEPDDAVYRPIWVSWQLSSARDVPSLVLAHLLADKHVVDGRVDYTRARAAPNRQIRGRAKISVALDPVIDRVDVPGRLSDLCSRAERDVVTHLLGEGVILRTVELAIAWRERWISR